MISDFGDDTMKHRNSGTKPAAQQKILEKA